MALAEDVLRVGFHPIASRAGIPSPRTLQPIEGRLLSPLPVGEDYLSCPVMPANQAEDLLARAGVGSQDAMVSNQVEPPRRYQSGELLQFQGGKQQMRGAIRPRRLKAKGQLFVVGDLQAANCQHAGSVAARWRTRFQLAHADVLLATGFSYGPETPDLRGQGN